MTIRIYLVGQVELDNVHAVAVEIEIDTGRLVSDGSSLFCTVRDDNESYKIINFYYRKKN
jgi:hypothetical protein